MLFRRQSVFVAQPIGDALPRVCVPVSYRHGCLDKPGHLQEMIASASTSDSSFPSFSFLNQSQMRSCLCRCRVSLISRSLAEFVYIRLASANSDINPSSFNSKITAQNHAFAFFLSRPVITSRLSSCKIATTIPLIPPSELHLVTLHKYTRPSGGVGGVEICVNARQSSGSAFPPTWVVTVGPARCGD